jgi:hypothetical protein
MEQKDPPPLRRGLDASQELSPHAETGSRQQARESQAAYRGLKTGGLHRYAPLT